MNNKNQNKAGFTLLEILIALFIFTILSMILVSALHGVMSTQSETEAKAIRLRKLQMALLLLSRDVEQTVDRGVLNSKGLPDPAFIGDAQSITFTHTGYANLYGTMNRPALQRVSYKFVNDSLQRESWNVLDQAAKEVSHARSLLEEISDVQFEYIDNTGHAHEEWPIKNEETQTLPRAIKMTLRLPNFGNMSQLYVIQAQPDDAQFNPPK